MSCLSSLEKTVHSLITEYPLGKVYPQFHITAFSLIPLVGAYIYYREYKNPAPNPNKIFLNFTDPRKTAIKFEDKIVPLVEKTQEKAISFLPETSPEKVKISPDIITQVKDNALLKAVIFQSVKLAFEHKFVEAKEALETFKRDYQCSPEEMQEISRRVDVEKQFIDQLELISKSAAFGSFDESSTIEDLLILAREAWENAMLLTEKKKELVSFFSLLEIGLSKKGWLESTSKERYEIMFNEMIGEINQQLEKTWIYHLMNRAYRALESSHEIDINPNYIEIPSSAITDKALVYLCQLAKYFHRLGNHEQSLNATFENIFLILKTKPIDVDECSNVFTLILSCYTLQQGGIFWALSGMRKSILENSEEAPQKKIQLLLVIQSDYKTLGEWATSDEILDTIIELINTLPQGEKKPWVEKAAIALNKMQSYEKANQLVKKHNESLEDPTGSVPLIQSVFLGVLALSILFVRPLYPLCACAIVPLIPKLLPSHRT